MKKIKIILMVFTFSLSSGFANEMNESFAAVRTELNIMNDLTQDKIKLQEMKELLNKGETLLNQLREREKKAQNIMVINIVSALGSIFKNCPQLIEEMIKEKNLELDVEELRKECINFEERCMDNADLLHADFEKNKELTYDTFFEYRKICQFYNIEVSLENPDDICTSSNKNLLSLECILRAYKEKSLLLQAETALDQIINETDKSS